MKYLEKLKKLNLPRDKFAIFGSGPMAIRNMREPNDIDIIVKSDLWKKLIKKYPVQEEKIKIGNLELFNTWPGVCESIDDLIDNADIIDGLRFVKLHHVLEYKKTLNRKKDRLDIKLIKDYLKNL